MNNQTIGGVTRALLQSLYTDTVQQWGVGGNAAAQLRALLDAPATEVKDRCGVVMVDCPECSHQWDHFFECGNKPAAQPQGDTVTFPRELSDELGELIAEKARVCGGGAFEIWEAICGQFGRSEQPAPVAVVLPERKTVSVGVLSESNTHNQGRNACLDDLKRLNPSL